MKKAGTIRRKAQTAAPSSDTADENRPEPAKSIKAEDEGSPAAGATTGGSQRPRDLGKVFDEFARELSALRQCFEVCSKALEDAQDASAQKATALLEKFKVQVSKSKSLAAKLPDAEFEDHATSKTERMTIRLPFDEAGRVVGVLESHIRSMQAIIVIRRSLLLASISQYDAFVAKLLEWLFFERPELLKPRARKTRAQLH